MQCLLDLLRAPANACKVSEPEWMTMLDLAEEERILPWTAACLKPVIGASTSRLAERLHEIDQKTRLQTFVWTSTLKSALAAFHRAGVPVISLKGPWLAERLYGDTAFRTYTDLDLLVHTADIARAEDLLGALCFIPAGRRSQYDRKWRRHGVIVELHHDVENPLIFDFGIERAWNRAQLSQFQGVPAWLLEPSDELLYLCLHGAKHRFERLSHILDLTFAFRCFPPPQTAAQMRRGNEWENVLAFGWMIATRFDPEIPTPEGMDCRIRNRLALSKLADELWQERMINTPSVVHWPAKYSFFLQIEPSRWRRLSTRARQWRILLTRLSDADFEFAERVSLHRSWQVKLLRPIRLLLKYWLGRVPNNG
jgi:Uncharacterised nucleotidyltransferase